MKKLFWSVLLLYAYTTTHAQKDIVWPDGKKAAIVLTYDDALLSHLDVAIPQLDKANIKGTFFLKEPHVQHIDRWREVSKNGHELGNHSLFHPCLHTKFKADPRYHAETYTVANIIQEISAMNKMLYAIDNKSTRTYAYPCGETVVGGKDYVDSLKRSGLVKYARAIGSNPVITDFTTLDPYVVPCKSFNTNSPAELMIDFVKQVQQRKGLGVLIFHGVGGDYLEVSADAHQQLIQYLNDQSKDVWVTTFEKAMDFIMEGARPVGSRK